MNKKIILGLIILIILIFGFFFRGWFIYIISGKITKNLCESNLIYIIFGMSRETKMDTLDNCIYSIAYYKNDPNLCEQSTNQRARDGCMIGVAFNRERPELCETIITRDYKEQCKSRYG